MSKTAAAVPAPKPGHVTYAAAPFDHPEADITLRSSDNVRFRVFRLLLSLASLFFESLFKNPQPKNTDGQEIMDGLVVIPMTEHSKTLDTLLRFCYPCTLAEDPHLKVFEDGIDVLSAARKYSFDAVEKKICQALSDPKILEAEPLRYFAIARRARLHEQTLLAARYTLSQPLVPSWFEEIDLITAADLLALLTYHKQCGDAVYALRNVISRKYWDRMARRSRDHSSCRCPRFPQSDFVPFAAKVTEPRWWEDFMTEIFTALRDRPCKATVETVTTKTVKSVKALDCPACPARVSELMCDFSERLVKKMDGVVSQIPLEFNPKSQCLNTGNTTGRRRVSGRRS